MMNRYAMSQELGALCQAKKLRIGLAESCTGGLLSSDLTSVPGCSFWFDGSLVVYSNKAKMICLGVGQALLEQAGAVSESVVKAMSQGVIDRLQSDIVMSISGVAGPAGGTDEKPVGKVWFALADKRANTCEAKCMHFQSGRRHIQASASEFALQWLIEHISAK